MQKVRTIPAVIVMVLFWRSVIGSPPRKARITTVSA